MPAQPRKIECRLHAVQYVAGSKGMRSHPHHSIKTPHSALVGREGDRHACIAAHARSMSKRRARSPARSQSGSAASATALPDFSPDSQIPHFDLDLDVPPSLRWNAIASAFRPRFSAMVERNRSALHALRRVPLPTSLLLRAVAPSQADRSAEVRSLSLRSHLGEFSGAAVSGG